MMKPTTPEAIARRFTIFRFFFGILCLLPSFLLIFFLFKPLLCAVLCLPILYLHRIAQLWVTLKTFLPILTKDMDAEKFRRAINASRGFIPPHMLQCLAQLNCGDYRTAATICRAQLALSRSSQVRDMYRTYLARIYLEQNDDARLRELVASWTYQSNPTKGGVLHSAFCEAYLAGRYDECLTHCQKRLQSIASQPLSYERICLMLWLGMIYERMGDIDAAREQLTFVRDHAPRLYASTLAQIHLDALEQGTPLQVPIAEIEPTTEDIATYTNELHQRVKHVRRNVTWPITLILGLLFALALCFRSQILFALDTLNMPREVRVALEENFDGVQAVEYFHIRKDGEIIDTVVAGLSDRADGLFSCMQTADGIEVQRLSFVFMLGYSYVYSEQSDCYIGMYMSTSPATMSIPVYQTESFSIGYAHVYLYITYIGDERPAGYAPAGLFR